MGLPFHTNKISITVESSEYRLPSSLWDCLECMHQLHLNKIGIIKHSVKFSYFSFEMYSHLIQIDVN